MTGPVPAPHHRRMRASPIFPRATPLQVGNRRNGATLASAVVHADDFWLRLVGLMGRDSLGAGEGLLLDPCNSVHTFFMSFRIDLVFLDRDDTVLKVVTALRPWRFALPVAGARKVLELPAGTVIRSDTHVGDRLWLSRGDEGHPAPPDV